MARRTFFSFHFRHDLWRANVVRNSWVTHSDRISSGFFDASLWEDAKKKGDVAIRKMIDDALVGTSVTVVLIGAETATRRYVKYEIDQSIERGNGLIGIYIHKIADKNGDTDAAAPNPLASTYPVYRWNADDGYKNIGAWVEAAAKKGGK